MNSLTTIVEITGWTLLHFLWQGAAIAAALWVILLLARRAGPQLRYAAAGVALLLMLGSVAGTALWLAGRGDGNEGRNGNEGSPAPPALPVLVESAIEGPPLPAPSHQSHSSYASQTSQPAPPEPPVASPAPAAAPAALPAALPWGVAAWAAGVAFFSLRLLLGWRTAQRWRRSGTAALPEEWRTRFAALCETMRLTRPVRLLASTALSVPVVIGWLRPVVLVPASLLTGLPAAQLQALLAHELAHVGRHDYLVNLLQSFAETLLFYHPAVWWVSSVMRREREHCCDDTATAVCGGALDYARALTALEEFRALPAAGLSAAAGPLLQRIRRLAGLPEERASLWPAILLAIAGLCLIPILRGGENTGEDKDAKSAGNPASSAAVETDPAEIEAALKRLETELKPFIPAEALKSPAPNLSEKASADGTTPEIADDYWKTAPVEELYIAGYLKLRAGDANAKASDDKAALLDYTAAQIYFKKVAEKSPGWHVEILQYRLRKMEEIIAATQKRLKETGASSSSAPHDPEDDKRRAFDIVHSFLVASSYSVKMRHHDLTKEALPKLNAYYERHPAKSFSNPKLLECAPTSPGRWKLMVEIAEIPEPQFFEVFEKDGKLLVDWETASLYQRDRYADLQKDMPKTAVPFMAVCAPDDYYNGPFADEKKFQCYRLTYPGVDTTLYGYVARDSETAKVIKLQPKRSLRLEVKFPEQPLHSNQVEIVKVAETSVNTALLEMKRFKEELELSVPAPKPQAGPNGELVVNVAPDGRIVMNSKTLTLDELQTQLAEVAKVDKTRAIIIRGDKSTQFDLIVKVLGVIHKAGLYHVSFATAQSEPKPHAPSNGDEQNGKTEPPAPAEGGKVLPPLEVERVDGPPLIQPTPSADEQARQITVTVTKDGALYLFEAKATDEEAQTQLAGMAKDDNTRDVLVHADKSTSAKRVVEVIGIVSKAGFKHVAFATANRPDPNKIVVIPKLPGDFTFTAKSHYPAHIVERPDGTLESSLGDLTPEDRIKLPQTASVITDSQGEHEIKYCRTTFKDGTLLLDFSDCGPAYHGSLSVTVAADQTFTCRWDFDPVAGAKVSTSVVSQKLTLEHWPPAAGKRLRGSIDVVLADKLPSGEEKKFYVRGLFDTPVGNEKAEEGNATPDPKAPAEQEGGKKSIRENKDGTKTETSRRNKGTVVEETFSPAGQLIGKRVFQTDSKGRVRYGVIFDGNKNPLSSIWFGYDKETGQPREERHYNRKGQLVRRLFYPGTLPDRPDLANRYMAVDYNPEDSQAKPVEVLDAATARPQEADPAHLQKSKELMAEAAKLTAEANKGGAGRKEKLERAFRLMDEAIKLALEYDKEHNDSVPNRALLGDCYLAMAQNFMAQEDVSPGKNYLQDAAVALTEAVKLFISLQKQHPTDVRGTVQLAKGWHFSGTLMRKQKKESQANDYDEGARKLLSTLKETAPHSEEVTKEIEALEKLLPPAESTGKSDPAKGKPGLSPDDLELVEPRGGAMPVVEKLTPEEEARKVTVGVKEDGSLFLNGKPVSADDCRKQLSELAKEDAGRHVLLRCDKRLPAKRVAEVITLISEAGLKKVAYATNNAEGPGISLTVKDSSGQKPVGAFRVIAGVPSSLGGKKEVIVWQPHTLREGKDGVLVWPLSKAYEKMALRVEADGFDPQIFSWIEKAKGAQELSFQLIEAKGTPCVVKMPDGKPAAGAVVALALVQREAVLEGGKLRTLDMPLPENASDRWRMPTVWRTDDAGRMEVPHEPDSSAVLLVMHESGVREMMMTEFRLPGGRSFFGNVEMNKIMLRPWAKVSGKVQWGDKPGAGAKVTLGAQRDEYGYPGVVGQYETVTAGPDGRFTFERVLPGLVQLSCPVAAGDGKDAVEANFTGRIRHVNLQPGENHTVVGGPGRTVKGRLTGRADWKGVTFHFHPTAPHIGMPGDDAVWKAWSAWQKSPDGAIFFRNGLTVQADGSFEIPGVLPGDYQIFFTGPDGKEQLASSNFSFGLASQDQRNGNAEPMVLPDLKVNP